MSINQPVNILSSRALMGMFWERISQLRADQASLLNRLALNTVSDQASEDYGWLGAVPKMSEWIGKRQAHKLRAAKYTITNIHYEATIEILLKDLRRDKTPQTRARINELADTTELHKYELLLSLMNGGAATLCYDGQFFYDTDHVEGDSGAQSNDLALTAVAGATPTQVEMASIIQSLLQAIYGFKDDRGRAMNRTARQFTLVVPNGYWGTALAAVNNNILGGASNQATSNPLQNLPVTIDVVSEPDLTAQTLQLFRTDGVMKPFITQEEEGSLQISAKAEGSEFEFDNAAHQYGTEVWRNAGYGLWQYAVLGTVTDA